MTATQVSATNHTTHPHKRPRPHLFAQTPPCSSTLPMQKHPEGLLGDATCHIFPVFSYFFWCASTEGLRPIARHKGCLPKGGSRVEGGFRNPLIELNGCGDSLLPLVARNPNGRWLPSGSHRKVGTSTNAVDFLAKWFFCSNVSRRRALTPDVQMGGFFWRMIGVFS